MEDGVKEETPEKPKGPVEVDKAGWIKKSSGGLLSLWKERYIQLCKSQLLMYENEEEQKCIETVELERYDRCQDLRALLKRKNRFILVRAPGYKVQDIKFQASNGEEKDSWMKALNDGINRGKNRILDEVKVDESLSLEHVTRRRAKVAQGRRPPTRSHLKEVASAVSDGILRLDLDVPDSSPPNITVSEAADVPPPKETPKPPMPPIKPPMLPTEEPRADAAPEDQESKKPPVPPAKPPKEAPGEHLNPVKEEEETGGDVVFPCEDAEKAKMESRESPVLPAKPAKEGAAASENTESVVMMVEERQPEEEKDAAVVGEEGEESKVALDGENLVEVGNYTSVPSAKILPDKVKVMWDSPASEEQDAVPVDPSTTGSKEDLQKVTKEIVKPPTPPPKIISEKLKASMNSKWSRLEGGVSEGDSQHKESRAPVNGFGGHGGTQPAFQDGEEAFQQQKKSSPEHGATEKALPSQDRLPMPEPVGHFPSTKPRCASLGDLLLGPTRDPLVGRNPWQGPALRMAQMEKKVACEQERTEKLLQKVLRGGLEQAQEGNGPPVNAESLLNEAAEQLRQATQVLKEIRDFGELKQEAGERQKGAPKDLVTLYRRSAP